jgi:hypothetical protein
MRTLTALFAVSSSVVLLACGPEGRSGGTGGGDGPDGGTTQYDAFPIGPEICDDGYDNDQDGRADCADVDCSGVGTCPVCGQVEVPEATPLALPDGVQGARCTTDADCAAAEPNCVTELSPPYCYPGYNSVLDFIGFPPGSTLTDPNQLLRVCVNMEHSWLRDLQIELHTPDGREFVLHEFGGRTGGEVYLGEANDYDSASNPVPGVGYEYCWTPTAAMTMLQTVNANPSIHILPAGDYKSFSPWSTLAGTPLNGQWAIRVIDAWGIDNGFLFGWRIEFDPTLVVDCSGPIIQ